jgi:hypothetical protein
MPARKPQSTRRRAAAGIASITTWRGEPLASLDPYTMTLLAESGHLDAVFSYDLSKHGARPLWHAILCHRDPDAYRDAIADADDDAQAEAEGKTWSMVDLARASRWLGEQAEQITAAMVDVETGEGSPGKPATSPRG